MLQDGRPYDQVRSGFLATTGHLRQGTGFADGRATVPEWYLTLISLVLSIGYSRYISRQGCFSTAKSPHVEVRSPKITSCLTLEYGEPFGSVEKGQKLSSYAGVWRTT